jgi:hypothetical protein
VTRDLEQWHVRGDECTGKVHSRIFQGENLGSGLNWLCLTMAFVEGIVLGVGTFFRVKS